MASNLPADLRGFVESQLASGAYGSEEELMEAALRRMSEQASAEAAGGAGGTAGNEVRAIDRYPLWGLFRDDPEAVDEVIRTVQEDRRRATERSDDE